MAEPDHRDADEPGTPDVEAAAVLAYDAWCDVMNVGHRDAQEPSWPELLSVDRIAWRAAARAILDVKVGAVLT